MNNIFFISFSAVCCFGKYINLIISINYLDFIVLHDYFGFSNRSVTKTITLYLKGNKRQNHKCANKTNTKAEEDEKRIKAFNLLDI